MTDSQAINKVHKNSNEKKIDVSSVLNKETIESGNLDFCVRVENLNLYYAKDKQALIDINLEIPKRKVTAFIGPSGCGKSSLL